MRRLPWPLLLAHEEDELLRDLLFGKKKDLEEGRAYLVKEKKPERALAAFQRAVDAGWRPIYITRQHPNHVVRSEEHTSELQSRQYLVCRLLLEKKKMSVNSALSSIPSITLLPTWHPL